MGEAQGFEFRESDGVVVVTHHGKVAAKLRADAAAQFLSDIERDDPQLVMARVTGNYKHGNERVARQHPRNADR